MIRKGSTVRAVADLAHSTWPTTTKPTRERTIKAGTTGTVVGVQQGTGLLAVKFAGHGAPKFGITLAQVEAV